MKLPSLYKLLKLILFIAAGVLILVFNKAIMNNEGALINGIVGCVIAVYGLEGIILPLATKKAKEEKVKMLNGAINVLIAVVMIFLLENHPHELRVVCVIWSIWSIMREGEEIIEKGFEDFKKHPIVSLINFAESVVVIVFSVMLVCAEDGHELMHHAHTHVILLGIELIIEVIWVYAGELETRLQNKFLEKRSKEKQTK